MDDLIKLFFVITLSLILTLATSLLEMYLIKDPLQIIIVKELFKLVPILIASRLLGCLVFGATSGLVFGITEDVLRISGNGAFAPMIILMHTMTGIILGASSYPYVKSKNLIFGALIFVGLGITFLIHYWFGFYQYNFIFAFKSLFYMFQ